MAPSFFDMTKDKIRVKHHAKWLKDCKKKTYKINGPRDLDVMAFLPRYKNKSSWEGSSRVKPVRLYEYKPNDAEKRHIMKLAAKHVGPVITIARYEDLDLAVIVDGVHRALGLRDGKIPFPATVIEYYGDMVPRVFCVEMMSLMLYYAQD